VKTVLPEGQAIALRGKGFTELPLARVNARLVPYDHIIHAMKSQDLKRLVVCTDEHGWVEACGRLELRATSLKAATGPTGK
jgi:hypothetical protein